MNEVNSDSRHPSEPLKAVIFGSRVKQIQQMSEQLKRKKILALPVPEERKLLSSLSEFDPDFIFLEINGETPSPIEQIVKVVFMWTKNYARKINKTLNSPSSRLWDKAKVIMFKTENEDAGANPAGVTIGDLDEVLFKCKEVGDVEYIGLYSSWSFFSKIEPLLKKQQ
ncbi:MAG: hypothetical protein IT395_05335 [Candidatus Omnitrophica bacterium]|nr:hypothetical protein [Candidatus Omnitrophota bacterium]